MSRDAAALARPTGAGARMAEAVSPVPASPSRPTSAPTGRGRLLERAAQALARRLGYDLVPRRKQRLPMAQLGAALARHGIDAVIDVGANRGQYGRALREAGWRGPILSIEPLSELHPAIAAAARADPLWQVAPPCAIGAADGEAVLNVSAESDMSSLQDQTARLRALAPTAAVRERRPVALRRLDTLALPSGGAADAGKEPARPAIDPAWSRLFVKLDLQGGETAALDGMEALWPRVAGLQVEMALLPLYEGEATWRATADRLQARGYDLHLLVPGYFERKLARQVQVDGVFFAAG